MTNTNTARNNVPFLLKPAAKDYLWGGNRLNEDFSKQIDLSPLAETWECSTHPDGLSTVASGSFTGQTLADVLTAHPEYLGQHGGKNGELPILIKLIDAKEDLSVQVHPDDVYAQAHEGGQRGKAELWYVLDALDSSCLTYGLHHPVDRAVFRESILNGTVEKYLQRVPVRKNDLFFIQPGTIHAIGAGVLLAEIQQSSNLTYRLYDYDRTDKNGKKRELHIDKALDVANLHGTDAPRQPLRVLRYRKGSASEVLYRCSHFQVERLLVNTERCREMAELHTDGLSFQVLLCVNGCGTLLTGGESLNFFKGDCIFIPASAAPFRLHGKAQLLKVRC